jgi:FkbM family methyltransferase
MNKIFIDCGTHNFQGFREFSKKYNIDSEWKCYCFESNPITYKQSKKYYDELTRFGYNINHYNNAVYIENSTIKVNCSLDCGGNISNFDEYSNQGYNILKSPPSTDKVYGGNFLYTSEEVYVDSIDFSNFISEQCNKDDFVLIKMDIEGAEFEVLEHIIENDTYKLINEIYCEWHDRFFENQDEYIEMKNNIKRRFIKQKIKIFDWI